MPAADITGAQFGEPATKGFAITPHDVNELPYVTRALYVGGAGNVVLLTHLGDVLTLVGAVAGSVLAVRTRKVYSTGTTASNLVGLL